METYYKYICISEKNNRPSGLKEEVHEQGRIYCRIS
jgi:hypothetical protein